MFGFLKRKRPSNPAEPAGAPPSKYAATSEQVEINRLMIGAAALGNPQRLYTYLQMGAQPSWRNVDSGFTFDPYKDECALTLAAASGSVACVAELLSRRADPNGRGPKGRTPLINAVLKGSLHSVKILLQSKADASLQDDDGNTACMYALKAGREDMAALFAKTPKPISLPVRALHWAVESGKLECVQVAVRFCTALNEPGEDGILALVRVRDLYSKGKLTKQQAGAIGSLLVVKGADLNKVDGADSTSSTSTSNV